MRPLLPLVISSVLFIPGAGRCDLCRVAGGAHSWVEDGKTFTSERYEVEAACLRDPDGAAPPR